MILIFGARFFYEHKHDVHLSCLLLIGMGSSRLRWLGKALDLYKGMCFRMSLGIGIWDLVFGVLIG